MYTSAAVIRLDSLFSSNVLFKVCVPPVLNEPRLKDLRKRIKFDLIPLYSEHEAAALATRLVTFFFGLKPYELALHEDLICQPVLLRKINQAVQRLKKNEPVQYVLGETEFCGLRLEVNPSVLIPRPETEELVHWILSEAGVVGEGARPKEKILDIGTGSGAIALALKNSLPDAQVTAMDISKEALKTALKNARDLGLEVEFVEADILDPASLNGLEPNGYTILVSNPPYVTLGETAVMHSRVLDFEPHQALFVSDDSPLIFYEAISQFAFQTLAAAGKLYFELNEKYGEEVLQTVESYGFVEAELRKDLNGKWRMLRAVKPPK